MDDNRLNFPHSSAVTIEVLGNQLQFSQDPNSKHLGTTVWDASMVFVKFLERNCRRGRFCRSKLKGKRVLELGAGCGLAGFGMALLGCNVVSTDQIEVLPLLMRNLDRNTSRVMQTNADSESFGSIEAAELDWGNMDHIKAVDPPFDYIIGTDIVYSEHLLEPLLHTICALSGPRSTILLGYEIRSMIVHEQMMDMWKRNFEVKTISKAKMDPKYQHSSIQLFILSFKNHVGPSREMLAYNPDCGEKNSDNEIDENSKHEMECLRGETFVVNDVAVGNDAVVKCEKLDDWETRRVGSLAARLLRDVTLG